MTRHIYSIGQKVSFDGLIGTHMKPAGTFTVIKLLPPLGVEFQYRIKSEREAYERVAIEPQLRALEPKESLVASDSRASRGASDAARVFAGIV